MPNRTEKQTMLFKAILNCLFNDIWCYLVIGSFDWKIGIFPQLVVKSLLYPQSFKVLRQRWRKKNQSEIWDLGS